MRHTYANRPDATLNPDGMSMMIESGVFRISSGRFAAILLQRHGQGWIACIGVLFITSLFLGIAIDYRIAVLAVILVCLIAPALLMILYYSFGMKGLNYLNVIDHRMEIGEKSLSVMLRIREGSLEEEKEDSDAEGEGEEWRRYDFPAGVFGRYSVGSDYVVFPFRATDDGFLYIPETAFSSREEFMEGVEMIAKGIKKEKE